MPKLILNLPSIFMKKKFFTKSQFWSEDRLKEYQNQKLIKIVKFAAKTVPYYQKLFKKINLDIDNFKGIEDMYKIPLLSKETLRNNTNDFISCKAGKFNHWDCTSGSTGKPLRLLVNPTLYTSNYAVSARAYSWANYKLGKKVLSIMSVSKNLSITNSYNKLANNLTYFSNQIEKNKVVEFYPKLKKFNPEIIWGYGYSILMFGKFLQEKGLELPKVKAIINFGENVSISTQKELEKMYNSRFFNYYSHTEKVVLAADCEHHSLHINEDFAYNEIIDKNGKNTNKGEIVGTTFYNTAMPLIRYQVGDFAELDSNKCKCGRNFRTIKTLAGRVHDGIITPDGRFVYLAEGAISASDYVIAGQYVQNSIDTLIVNLKVDPKFSKVDEENILKGLKLRFGNAIKININIVNELIKLKNGKTPFIISNLKNKNTNITQK